MQTPEKPLFDVGTRTSEIAEARLFLQQAKCSAKAAKSYTREATQYAESARRILAYRAALKHHADLRHPMTAATRLIIWLQVMNAPKKINRKRTD